MPIFFVYLFSSEVSRNLAPFGGFPLDDGVSEIMRNEPLLSSQNNLIEFLRLWGALELGLTLALLNPEDGVVRVGIDGLVVQTLIPAKGEGVYNSKELPDIIRAMNRAEVKHLIACL